MEQHDLEKNTRSMIKQLWDICFDEAKKALPNDDQVSQKIVAQVFFKVTGPSWRMRYLD